MKKAEQDIFEPPIPIVPQGWDVLSFEEAASVISDKGKRVKQGDYLQSGKLPVIDQGQDYIGGYTDDDSLKFDGELPVILFGDHTRSVKFVDKPFVVGAQGIKILKPNEGYDPKYFFYLMRSLRVPSRGYSRHFQFLRKFHLPRAPEDQQKQIVAEIEKQFSRLDEAVANLKRIKANLKRYKAAVLKAAVEGHLVETEAELARREGRSYETGAQLLQRILETRRSQWKGKGRYKAPATPDTTDLPELPEGWEWATVDQLLVSLRNGLSRKPEDSEPGIPILRISAVRPLGLDTKDTRFYRPEANENAEAYNLEVKDVLFVRYNGNKEFVGACALVRAVSGVLLYPDKLIRGRVVSGGLVLPGYLAIAANVGKSRQHIDELIKTTAGQQGISGGEIKKMPIPLMPQAEQARIVAEVDSRLSLILESESQVDVNLRRAERLRRSILSGVFRMTLQQK
jgi:type I restriction enzyme S subunit